MVDDDKGAGGNANKVTSAAETEKLSGEVSVDP